MLVLFGFSRAFRSMFEGKVCIKIPFKPWGIITKISHGGLDTDDMSDGSYMFVYWLSNMFFKECLNRVFGFVLPSSGMNAMQERLQQAQQGNF